MQRFQRVLEPLVCWRSRTFFDRGGVRYRGRPTNTELRKRERAQKRQHWLKRYWLPKQRAAAAATAREKHVNRSLDSFDSTGAGSGKPGSNLPPLENYMSLYRRLLRTEGARGLVGGLDVANVATDSGATMNGVLSEAPTRAPHPERHEAQLVDQLDREPTRLQEVIDTARRAYIAYDHSTGTRPNGPSLGKALELGRCILRIQQLLRHEASDMKLVQAFVDELGMTDVFSTVYAAASTTSRTRPASDNVDTDPRRTWTLSAPDNTWTQTSGRDSGSIQVERNRSVSLRSSSETMLDALSRVLALAMLRSFATFKQGHDFSSTTAVEANLWTPYLQFLQRPSAQQADALIRADLNSLGAFTILMTSLSRAQCDDAAIAVFDMLLARKGNTLDVVVCNVAMRALANLGKVERVVQLLATMLQPVPAHASSTDAVPSIQPDWNTWRYAVEACLRRRDVQAAWAMYKQATTLMLAPTGPSSASTSAAGAQPPLHFQRQMAYALAQAGHISPLMQMLEASERAVKTLPVETWTHRHNEAQLQLREDAVSASDQWPTPLAFYAVQAVRKAALRVVWSLPTATASPPAASVATNNAIIELNSILDKLQQAYKEPMQRLYQMRSVLKRERTLSPLPTPPPQQEALDSVSSRQPFLDTIPPEELFIQARCALRQDDIVDAFLARRGLLHHSSRSEQEHLLHPMHETTCVAILEMAASRGDDALARKLYALLETQNVRARNNEAAIVYLAMAIAKCGHWQEAWSLVQRVSGFDPTRKARDQVCLRYLLDACQETSARQRILNTLGVAIRRIDDYNEEAS
ncbi:hypothetical protein CCYA_CCYA17G4369 [Cyanidiococcus yangmingshanensis]|nr:hypothetical protein CCYA_CCYA17G4369 [Cyanidiococcus yangmingshanensis]